MISIILVVLLSSSCNLARASEDGWSYEGDDGPENWVKGYRNCGGKRQSPIDIKGSDTKSKTRDPPLENFVNYNKYSKSCSLTNNGHSVQLKIEDFQAQFTNSDSSKKYNFVQLHFHWGSENDKGSEHSFDDRHLALEVHLVHQEVKRPNRLAVVAVLFKAVEKDNGDLEPIVEVLRHVRKVGLTTGLEQDFRLSNLIPNGKLKYFTYSGSLTTPPCTEDVVWIVFRNTNEIGINQLEKFRSLEMNAFNLSVSARGNARPLQELNGRTVYYSKTAVVLPNTLLLLFVFLGRIFWLVDY
ncbi:carbonic anhydrase 2-like [Centruroides sculpturatus]|uniref:carbonic anhydrase 2-like n=1 Tax=Centruroides sculpturatus TaxID=218467 RepID=UPI000C6DBFC7|nr:carbonic anhydrase 2-like [Centruroides sculpturatus]